MRLSYEPRQLRRATAAGEFGRVAVLFGGDSSEREISLLSGNAVLEALKRRGVDAHAFDPRDAPLSELIARGFERVWIALHGPGGEDGTLQGALEYLGVPYTGSGVMGSAIGMDKLRTKRLARAVGVATADFVVLCGAQDFEAALERLKLPLIVKPATQGSSVGMSKVERAADLPAAYALAARLETLVFAEAWIAGPEYTVAILQERALPSIRIETPRTFYDYEAKYFRDDTRYFCPSGLSRSAEEHLASLALAAFEAAGASGWGRADFMMDAAGRPLLLEINTVPGMTSHSLVPMAARAIEVEFEELVWRVLETSFTRRPAAGGPRRGAPPRAQAAAGACGERAARLAPGRERAGHRADRRGALGREGAHQPPWRAVRLRPAPHSAGARAAHRPRGQGVARGAALSGRGGAPVAGGPAPHGDAPGCTRRLGIRSGQRRHRAPRKAPGGRALREIHEHRAEARHPARRGHRLRGYALHKRLCHRLARRCRPRRRPRRWPRCLSVPGES